MPATSRRPQHAIATSCRAKAAIVAADETETGGRALLNLGHTFGHALEAATGYGAPADPWRGGGDRHGHGIRLSERLGRCPPGTAARVEAHLRGARPAERPRRHPAAAARRRRIARHHAPDKKARAGEIAFVLVRGIGEAYVETGIPEEAIIGFLADELAMQ